MDYDLFQLCYPTHYFGIHFLIQILDFAGSNFATKQYIVKLMIIDITYSEKVVLQSKHNSNDC